MSLIKKHHYRFHLPDEKPSTTELLQHKITVTDETPIFVKQYRLPPAHKREVASQVQKYLEDGIVKPPISPYSNPVFIIPKKSDSQGNKKYRMVLDFRKLNNVTVGDRYPLPNISDILDQLGGAQYFTLLDLFSGYHQVKLDEKDAARTAFSVPQGHFEFTRLAFGLSNAPRTFQRLMDLVLSGLQGSECYVYLDDVVIYARSLQEHEEKFSKIMDRITKAN